MISIESNYEDDDDEENDDDDLLTQDIQKPKNFIRGTLTKIKANSSLTSITIHLKERLIKKLEEEEGEEEKEHIASQSTSNKLYQPKRKFEQEEEEEDDDDDASDHTIKLIGTWCQIIVEDLKITLNLKIYLDCYEPEFDLKEKYWEFRNGIHADFFIQNSIHNNHLKAKIYMKKIDLCLLNDPVELNIIKIDEEEINYKSNKKKKINQRNLIQINSFKDKIKNEDISEEEVLNDKLNNHHSDTINQKRIRTDIDLHSVVEPTNEINHNQVQSSFISSTDSSVPPNLNPTSVETNLNQTPDPDVSTTQIENDGDEYQAKSKVWKTLDEIDKMVGGPGERFNVISIINSKQTDTCKQATGGTLDYKMTLYLTDNSRPRGSRDVTCNLFSKTEQESPPWISADWAVIMLFGVYKRRSDIYSTQIVGPTGSFHWAIWSPAYLGSAEKLILSSQTKNQLNDFKFILKFNLSEDDLKSFARQLHLLHQQSQSSMDYNPSLSTLDSHNSLTSIPKNISELRHGLRQQVDLCVKVIDVWIDSPGKDRITVTDYTSNPTLKVPTPRALVSNTTTPDKLSGQSSPILQFHLENGGSETNWKCTEHKIMSIYIAQPILQVFYHKFQQDLPSSNQYSRLNPFDIKSALTDKFVKLSQVELRAASGSSNAAIFYGLITNPISDITDAVLDSQSGYFNVEGLDESSLNLLASKIVPLKPSDPSYRQLVRAQKAYQLELENAD